MRRARTLLDKIWESHIVHQEKDAPTVIYIDLHLIHEVTSPQAFQVLRERGLKLRRPHRTVATIDHSVPTLTGPLGRMAFADDQAVKQVSQLEVNCEQFGIQLYGLDSPNQGIVHIIGPELGITQPGMTIVCGDSHTATHGAFGALAFGIGTSEVGYVFATQCLLQSKPQAYQVNVEGKLPPGVGAKDLILWLIHQIGVGGGIGCVFEFGGPAIRALSMEERMTLCNMSIEGGARAGMVAPDETTYEYMAGREWAPKGAEWEASLKRWKALPADEDASYDKSLTIDGSALQPMITFGTNPGLGMPIGDSIPLLETVNNREQRVVFEKALAYMGLKPGQGLLGHKVDAVFIGSCTNGRLSDLRAAAAIMKDRSIAPGLRVLVVPGSQQVKAQAEAEGLDRIFKQSGAEWREPGCSMCLGMNGDLLQPGEYAVSTSNRNFEGRQGRGVRTFLASPLTAAATAVNGHITDPRTFPFQN